MSKLDKKWVVLGRRLINSKGWRVVGMRDTEQDANEMAHELASEVVEGLAKLAQEVAEGRVLRLPQGGGVFVEKILTVTPEMAEYEKARAPWYREYKVMHLRDAVEQKVITPTVDMFND